ncbi:MAG: class I SAM-dependent methyltransferase [Thermoleophilaceae bacterium]
MTIHESSQVTEKEYLRDLEALENLAYEIPNTHMGAMAKLTTLITLNMRWERVAFDRSLEEHPWRVAQRFIREAAIQLTAWRETLFIETPGRSVASAPVPMEEGHRDLFQALWVNFSPEEYQGRIERFVRRLDINNLGDGFLSGMRCIDFGCGHGNFAHSLLERGAGFVLGIDYGEDSIRYATEARDALGVPAERLAFRVASVYEVGEPDESFDFALQNGVFHHLDDEDRAYAEVHRVLRAGGWMWAYTDGDGAVARDLFDASVRILQDIPADFIVEQLDGLGVGTNKRYHLGDALNATYRHTTWTELTDRLSTLGFGNFRRLVGGFPTDFDHDVIEDDPWGQEKFGEGNLRVLAQKVS